MRFISCTLFVVFFSSFYFILNGQSGNIAGIIIDKETKETVIGANVSVLGTTNGATTDLDGYFVIRNLTPGTYQIEVTSLGFETINISDVTVTAGKTTDLNVSMGTSSLLLNEVQIVEYRVSNTEAAVLLEVKQAKQVVSAISSQQIAKSQDNNAAQVMQRVPGVTIVENRFVMIRGLSERYNNVMINNVVAPSTEVDKRTFSFDLISSNSLDRMLVFKSGSAELPGDFSGGVIKLFTIDGVDKPYTKISIGTGIRNGTTFQPYFQSQGSGTDFLGFDNGFRKLPSTFPSSRPLQESNRNSQIRVDAANSLPNNFNPVQSTTLPDISIGFAMGRNFDLNNDKKLTMINVISYSRTTQYYLRDFARYLEWEDRTNPILTRFEFEDDTYQQDTRLSVLSNWTLKLNDKSKIKFKNLFNQIGENETIIRNGFDYIQRPNDDLRNYLLGYRSRSIYSGQLEGSHDLNEKNQLTWVLGGSLLSEKEPDLRRFRTFKPKDSDETENYTMQLPPSSNLFETGRYYGDLMEFTVNQGMDWKSHIDKISSKGIDFKAGYYLDYKYRDFSSRYFSYLYPGFFNSDTLQRLNKLPLTEIFAPQNIRTVDGFTIEEGTRPIDSYSATNFLSSGYASAEVPLDNLTIIAGFRGEYNIQTLDSRDDASVIRVNNAIFSPLPFLNLSYNFTPSSIMRLGYGRTVNRPEFRELAPFLFYDYKLEAARVGNPDLRTATIDNLDLRYEFYPRSGEVISVAAFFKNFDDPIENKTIISTEQPSFTYINADFARNYGIEIEVRKSLRGVTNSPFLDQFSFNVNASLIRSEVDLGSSAVVQDRIRPLQGQSPYIVNAAFYYENLENGLSISGIYNIFGTRIFSVGDVLFPTIYELPRNSVDISVTKKIGTHMSIKLGVQDLLNARFRFYQDSNRNGKIDNQDHSIFTFKRGQLVNLTFTYDLYK